MNLKYQKVPGTFSLKKGTWYLLGVPFLILWGGAIGADLLVYAIPLERPNPDGRLNPADPVEVRILKPEMDEVLKTSRVRVEFEITNFEMKKNGPHLHLVLDNGPFVEHFDAQKPFIFQSLSPGAHLLAVFPVTSWHESWKDKESIALVRFYVRSKTPDPGEDLEAPLLIFNMPQGKAGRWVGRWILFDFWLLNAQIASGDTRIEDHRVRYVLDGAASLLEYWETRFWLDLANGDHEIQVELTDRRGRFVPNGRWNRVRRAFYV